MAGFKLAGRFIKSLPVVGDIAAGGMELMDPMEPLQKNIKDALMEQNLNFNTYKECMMILKYPKSL